MALSPCPFRRRVDCGNVSIAERQAARSNFLPSPACYDIFVSSKHRQKGGTGKPPLLLGPKEFEGRVHRLFLYPCAALVAPALAQLCIATMGLAQEADNPSVTLQPDPSPDVLPFYRDWTKGAEPRLSREETIERLRAAVKYVLANGIYSDGQHPRAPKDTPGFAQTYRSLASGETVTVEPFLIGPNENANTVDSVDRMSIATPFRSFGNMPVGSFSSIIFSRPKIRRRRQTQSR
jgi:hypothetical protein